MSPEWTIGDSQATDRDRSDQADLFASLRLLAGDGERPIDVIAPINKRNQGAVFNSCYFSPLQCVYTRKLRRQQQQMKHKRRDVLARDEAGFLIPQWPRSNAIWFRRPVGYWYR